MYFRKLTFLLALLFLFASGTLYAQDFSLTISVSDGEHTQDLTIGMSSNATDGYDSDTDVLIPGLPPEGAFGALISNDQVDSPLSTDIRSSTESATTYELEYQPDENTVPESGESSITLSWDNSNLSSIGSFVINDGDNTIDMTQTSSFDVSSASSDLSGGLTITVDADAESGDVTYGDVTGDGSISALDASQVLQAVVNKITLDETEQEAADVSGDGGVSALDASYILQYVVDKIDSFPVENSGKMAAAADVNSGQASAQLAWGEIRHTSNGSSTILPLRLEGDASEIYAVELTTSFEAGVELLETVEATLPDSWQMVHRIDESSGTLRIAMAGSSPVEAGQLAAITLSSETSGSPQLSSEGRLNERERKRFGTPTRELPEEIVLEPNYPNPFNPSTNIEYQIPEAGHVHAAVYDARGRMVRTLVNEQQNAGTYSVQWNGRNESGQTVSSGMYLYRLEVGSYVETRQMMLVK